MKEQNDKLSLSSSANSTEVNLHEILVRKTSPMLVTIKTDKGQQAAINVMVAMMDACQQYFNLQQPMNAQQLSLTAELILEDYYYLRVEELQICFRMAMKGEFGPLYNRIDGQVFFEWIKKYMTKRGAVTERIQQEKQTNNNIYEVFNHPQIESAMKDVYDKIAHKESPQPEAKRPGTSPFEKKILDEYDALPEWKESRWFKVYQNKPYQFTEYRKQRYMEEINNQNEY